MEEREWISQEKMFWSKEEWDEAYNDVCKHNNFLSLNSCEIIYQMIGFLMHEYPVSMSQLREAKEKHGHL